MAAASYDPGEQLRISRDAHATLRVEHGAHEIATIKRALGGAVRIDADGRSWRLTTDDDGWTAAGEPHATFRRRLLRSAVLTIGDDQYEISRRTVKGLLRFRKDTDGARPIVRGEILAPPPQHADQHAVIALATAAVVLGVDLTTTSVGSEVNGDNRSAAIRYGPGI
ncbi:MAG: hypothetical protein M3320_02985 [Actinomycetota bacterium]|nr:hypothetical protein [Actinomycetota bacterium]MDQ5807619.1 hypothetical protein [Actinomycetota bacterium]